MLFKRIFEIWKSENYFFWNFCFWIFEFSGNSLANPRAKNPTPKNPTPKNPALKNPTRKNPTRKNPTENPVHFFTMFSDNKHISTMNVLSCWCCFVCETTFWINMIYPVYVHYLIREIPSKPWLLEGIKKREETIKTSRPWKQTTSSL